MSAARLIYILGILQQETNADKAMTLHQIYDKLLLLHPEEHCSEQRVQTRICLMQNEKLPQTLQLLYQALDSHRCLDFTYCRFDLDGRQKPLKQYRKILPMKVVWEKEHYYLVALNPAHPAGKQQRNYRVDRMENLSLSVPFWCKIPAVPLHYGQFDMFPAQEKVRVTFRLHRDLLDMAFETFGTGIRPVADEEKRVGSVLLRRLNFL